jgi:hypothetical protein
MTPAARRITVVLATLALAAPASVDAARPIKGTYLNDSESRGVYLVTTRHTIKTLQFYCRNAKHDSVDETWEYRQARYEVLNVVPVRRDGSFSYRGKAERYGPEGQPLGRWKIRLSGRFTSSRRVVIERRAADCGGTTVRASAES